MHIRIFWKSDKFSEFQLRSSWSGWAHSFLVCVALKVSKLLESGKEMFSNLSSQFEERLISWVKFSGIVSTQNLTPSNYGPMKLTHYSWFLFYLLIEFTRTKWRSGKRRSRNCARLMHPMKQLVLSCRMLSSTYFRVSLRKTLRGNTTDKNQTCLVVFLAFYAVPHFIPIPFGFPICEGAVTDTTQNLASVVKVSR